MIHQKDKALEGKAKKKTESKGPIRQQRRDQKQKMHIFQLLNYAFLNYKTTTIKKIIKKKIIIQIVAKATSPPPYKVYKKSCDIFKYTH